MSGDFYHHNGDTYEVTGVLTNGKRFKPIVTSNPHHALGINLYRGTVWQRKAGETSRRKVKEVWN